MAKTPEKKRRPKEKACVMTSKEVRQLGDELRELASRVDRYADAMDDLKMQTISPLMGNWHHAQEILKNFLNQQFITRLLKQASQAGRDAHDVMRSMIDSQ